MSVRHSNFVLEIVEPCSGPSTTDADVEVWSSTIARFDEYTKLWSKIGDLNVARAGLSVIFDGSVFLVIGGWVSTVAKLIVDIRL